MSFRKISERNIMDSGIWTKNEVKNKIDRGGEEISKMEGKNEDEI